MAKLKDTQIDGNLYVSEDIQIGDISVTDKINELNDTYYNNPSYSNPNLLINGNFANPIKQRGTDHWVTNTNDKYTIDRWKSNGCSVVTSNGKYITIIDSYKDDKGSAYLTQLFEDALSGTYAITVSVRHTNRGVLKVYLKGFEEQYLEISTKGEHSFTFNDVTNASGLVIELVNFYGDLDWIKLEQGSVATPFVPRHYAEELMLCQRYFINYKPLDHTGLVGSDGKNIYLPLQITTNMRTIPTVVHNITSLYVYYNGNYHSGVAVSNVTVNQDYELKFGITAISSVKNCGAGFYWTRGSQLWLDAEIY